jgi:hypothetical protein
MAKVTCDRCGHAIPADPKHPAHPGLHFCAPDEPLAADPRRGRDTGTGLRTVISTLHRQQHDAAIREVLEAADEWLDTRQTTRLAAAVRAWRRVPHAHGESSNDR